MNDQAIREIVDECEEHWSRSGVGRMTVMRLCRTLENDLGDRNDAHLAEVLADTSALAQAWSTGHRDPIGRVADALGYGVLLVVVSWASVDRFGEFSAPVAWAVPVTFMAALALLIVARMDPFRR